MLSIEGEFCISHVARTVDQDESAEMQLKEFRQPEQMLVLATLLQLASCQLHFIHSQAAQKFIFISTSWLLWQLHLLKSSS